VRVLLSTYGSRGDVEPRVGLAVRLRALGAEVRVRAPQDWAERLPEVGVPLVPVGVPGAADWPGISTCNLAKAPTTSVRVPKLLPLEPSAEVVMPAIAALPPPLLG